MGKIHRLPDALADQIAAGEVVERPASVAKELSENAIDAGARRVTVEIDQGGLVRIAVTDDGEGMSPEDARLAFERHATSKIHALSDLDTLLSFGFRGEALPSIASVSRVTLVTRERGASEGTRIVVEGGRLEEPRPAGAAEGTRIDVADLFYNVPARRKFMKASSTESAHVGEVVLHAALSRPEVAFRLLRDGRLAREYLRASSREERVCSAVSGEELRAVSGSRGVHHVQAFLSAPERARSGATGLEILINDRPVKDRALSRAVAQGYGSVLEPGRFPVGVVYIDLPTELVDINAHPRKTEVRFRDARELHGAVVRILNESLGRVFAVPALGLGKASEAPAFGARKSGAEPMQAPGFIAVVQRHSGDQAAPDQAPLPVREPSAPFTVADEARSPPPQPPAGGLARTLFSASQGSFYGKLRFLGQVRSLFLVCEGDDALYVLDQHAAAERVTFHRLQIARKDRKFVSQRLLVPVIVDCTAREQEALLESAEEVLSLGFDVRAAGDRSLAIHAVPELLLKADPSVLLRDLLAELARSSGRSFGGRIDLVLATMACHGSVRGGDRMEPRAVTALLEALDEVDFSGHCPHGRPVVTRIPFDELERRVGR